MSKRKEPFQMTVDVDDCTVTCPCGASVTGEGIPITQFVKKHLPHTNGRCVEQLTAKATNYIRYPGNKTSRRYKFKIDGDKLFVG